MATTVEVKKSVVKKSKAPKTASHPSYFEMIKEAILALKEKSGSSPHAIAKHMEEKHKAVLPANFRKVLALQLKNSAAKGKLIKIKASFKLSEAAKKAAASKNPASKAKVVKKPAAAKTGVKKAAVKKVPAAKTGVKKPAVKKVAKKKTGAVKPVGAKKSAPGAKPKLPKSIKSPAAKKAKRAVTAKA